MKEQVSRRFLAVVLAFLTALALWTYTRFMPRLARATPREWRHQVDSVLHEDHDSRAAVAALREYLLEYPEQADPSLRFRLLRLLTSEADADLDALAGELDRQVRQLLQTAKSGQIPSVDAFVKAGFSDLDGAYYSWPPPFVRNDLDNDGHPDLFISYPPASGYLFNESTSGIGLLYLRDGDRWTSHRIGTGWPVLSAEAFSISRSGPTALVVCSLADSAYRPNLLLDVFTVQGRRPVNVLSTRIERGWQWDQQDADGDGVQELRIVENMPDWNETARRSHSALFRWDGRHFTLAGKRQPLSHPPDPYDLDGRAEFTAGRYPEALRKLQKPGQYDDPQARFYYLALCHALLGHHAPALSAMSQAGDAAKQDASGAFDLPRTATGKPIWITAALADRFLQAARSPRSLPAALASVGQLQRVLEAHPVPSGASPSQTLRDLGLAPRFYRELDLTGDGLPEALAGLAWTGGSSVVLYRQSAAGQPWTVQTLAYGTTLQPDPSLILRTLPAEDVYYLPQKPALQLLPLATEVSVDGVSLRSGLPEVRLRYRQEGKTGSAALRWNGAEFMRSDPEGFRPYVDPKGELNRIERMLFIQREFRAALKQLDGLAPVIRESRLSPSTRDELLLETFYHQAICYRKLGDRRRAAVIYNALRRGRPETEWGQLAGRRLVQKP